MIGDENMKKASITALKVMSRREIREVISGHRNAGTMYLLLDYLMEENEMLVMKSHNEMAEAVKMTRPSVKRALVVLKALGMIDIAFGRVMMKVKVLPNYSEMSNNELYEHIERLSKKVEEMSLIKVANNEKI